jgi:putative chitinase
MLFKFNRETFLAQYQRYYRQTRRKELTQRQIDALYFLLSQIENDNSWQMIEHLAYALGTVMHETAFTFEPIDELGGFAYFERRYGYNTAVGKRLGNDAPGEGAKYHGRGDVQITGETNYERLEIDLRKNYPALIAEFEARTGQSFDLTDSPAQAKDKAIAYAVMAFGMYHGRFTGKSFATYIYPGHVDYVNARRIINGLDRANDIAAHARAFEAALRAAQIMETAPAQPEALVAQPPAADTLSTPVALERVEPHDTNATTAFEAIKSYAQAAAKATGITSLGGVIATVTAKLTGVHIPAEYVTYIVIAVAVLIFLLVTVAGAALIFYVIGRFVLTGLREYQAHKLNLAQLETVANPGKQAVTFVGGVSA